MPLRKESTVPLQSAAASGPKDHPLKRKQPLSFDERSAEQAVNKSDGHLSKDLTKNKLVRSNDLLTQSSTETLLEMLKEFASVKECSDETQTHLNMVNTIDVKLRNFYFKTFYLFRSFLSFTLVSKAQKEVRVVQFWEHFMDLSNAIHPRFFLLLHV